MSRLHSTTDPSPQRGSDSHNWPPEKIAQLRALVEEGLSDTEIAKRFGTSRTTIFYKRKRHGIEATNRHFCPNWPPEKIAQLRALVEERLSDQEIGERLGASSIEIVKYRRIHGISALCRSGHRTCTPEHIAQLRALAEEGLSDREIGERLGCGRKAILHQRRRYGIKAGLPRGARPRPLAGEGL